MTKTNIASQLREDLSNLSEMTYKFNQRLLFAYNREQDRRAATGEPRLTYTDIWKAAGKTSGAATNWFNGTNGMALENCIAIKDVLHWIITAAIVFAVYSAAKRMFGGRGSIGPAGSMVCPSCGTRGEPKTITRGSTLIELILWLCFIVPGLIYSIWRLTTRQKGCPACGAGMIPVSSPVGQKMVS